MTRDSDGGLERLIEAGARALAEWENEREYQATAQGRRGNPGETGFVATPYEDWHKEYDEEARVVLEGAVFSGGCTGLMDLARLILKENYPEGVFTGRTRNSDADPGVQLVQALRACDDAMTGANDA